MVVLRGRCSEGDQEVIAEGLEACKRWIREAIDLQDQLVDRAGVRPDLHWESQLDYGDDVAAKVDELGRDRLAEASRIADKTERNGALDAAKADIVAALCGEGAELAGRGARSRPPSARSPRASSGNG